jgi:hypothetical protein
VTCAENVDVVSTECTGLMLCVKGATTYFDVITKLFDAANIKVVETDDAGVEGLTSGECNVYAGGLAENMPAVSAAGGGYTISDKLVSKDPLALVTKQDDGAQWADFVHWIIVATFYAEENDITSATAS